jgi:RimJ/RimL family protein N-acetyltransferase/catechol 2,3-dioxygenase-like lactoylglutathione lyase family enzyme
MIRAKYSNPEPFMHVTTPRLTLRHFVEDDGAFYCQLVNQPSWLANIGERNIRSAADAAAIIRDRFIPNYQAWGYGMYVVERTADRTPVGICGLVKRDTLPDPDLGFALLEAHWGQGYAAEASRAVLDHARDRLHLRRLLAILTATNERSRRLLLKLGFTPAGTITMGEVELQLCEVSLAPAVAPTALAIGQAHLRVARPTDNLDAVVRFYRDGLGLSVLSSFTGHDGFDGVMLGDPAGKYHLEFTHAAGHHAGKAPTQDNLLVFYLPDEAPWQAAVHRMQQAGYTAVKSFNPYWDRLGHTYEDPDGYRVVLQKASWPGCRA